MGEVNSAVGESIFLGSVECGGVAIDVTRYLAAGCIARLNSFSAEDFICVHTPVIENDRCTIYPVLKATVRWGENAC